MELHSVVPIINEDAWDRGHQTLVVVFSSQYASLKFIERSNRFINSLNTASTIKADVMTVADGVFYFGLVTLGNKPGGRSQSDIKQFAKKKGYAQVCILEATDDE